MNACGNLSGQKSGLNCGEVALVERLPLLEVRLYLFDSFTRKLMEDQSVIDTCKLVLNFSGSIETPHINSSI